MLAPLVLGAVQLGLSYGAANQVGKPPAADSFRLLDNAASNGVTCVDTARAYGDSEERIGAFLRQSPNSIQVITKLSPLRDLAADATPEAAAQAAEESVRQSLTLLGGERISTLLLHDARHLVSHGGGPWARLRGLKAAGKIGRLGVSVQSTAELVQALDCPDVEHVQLPLNVLDHRWRAAGVPALLRGRPDVTVHVRSVFLQGLLVGSADALWPRIAYPLTPPAIIQTQSQLVRAFGRQSMTDLLVAYVRSQDWIDGVVLGMETLDQLHQNLALFGNPGLTDEQVAQVEAAFPAMPEELLNPALWPRERITLRDFPGR